MSGAQFLVLMAAVYLAPSCHPVVRVAIAVVLLVVAALLEVLA